MTQAINRTLGNTLPGIVVTNIVTLVLALWQGLALTDLITAYWIQSVGIGVTVWLRLKSIPLETYATEIATGPPYISWSGRASGAMTASEAAAVAQARLDDQAASALGHRWTDAMGPRARVHKTLGAESAVPNHPFTCGLVRDAGRMCGRTYRPARLHTFCEYKSAVHGQSGVRM
ncbi:MAG: DUF6498-containing protein [Actinobacteria bacterium]|nr:DUF6498-containing protein [Actinomycetota bacterium]MCL5888172.1 DUF6498-containing protein [Actinomycetota bacterium]